MPEARNNVGNGANNELVFAHFIGGAESGVLLNMKIEFPNHRARILYFAACGSAQGRTT